MFPLALIILLAPLTQAESSSPIATRTQVVSTLVPPYRGPASYYASILSRELDGTSYAVTCIPPATITGTGTAADPCQTSEFGTSSQTFFQAANVVHLTHPLSSGTFLSTECGISTLSGAGKSIAVQCYDRDTASSDMPKASQAPPNWGPNPGPLFAMTTQDVTVTAGWENLGIVATPVGTTGASMPVVTDVRATTTATTTVSKATATDDKPGSAASERDARKGVVVAGLGVFVALGTMW